MTVSPRWIVQTHWRVNEALKTDAYLVKKTLPRDITLLKVPLFITRDPYAKIILFSPLFVKSNRK
jgi:hypothetical protein